MFFVVSFIRLVLEGHEFLPRLSHPKMVRTFFFLPQTSRTIVRSTLKPSEHGEDLDLSFSQASIYNSRFRVCSTEALLERSDVITN